MPIVPKLVTEHYRLGKTIGEGSFSEVRLAVIRTTNTKVAIKILSKTKLATAYEVYGRQRERAARGRSGSADHDRLFMEVSSHNINQANP